MIQYQALFSLLHQLFFDRISNIFVPVCGILHLSHPVSYFKFLGTFAHLPSSCPSAWKNSAPTGRIFMKFDI